jgi:hypothetical protein
MRTLNPGRRQVNVIESQKREHSRKPDEIYDLIEACSPGPYLELFARSPRRGWTQWGNEVVERKDDLQSGFNVVPINSRGRREPAQKDLFSKAG